jgi:hypothetical protein
VTTKADLKKARDAGLQYVDDQLGSDHFHHYVWNDLHEGYEMEKRDPASVRKGLETVNLAHNKSAAVELAQIMLQQLRWDIGRDISDNEVEPYLEAAGVKGDINQELRDAFSKTVREALESDATEAWFAEEIIMPIAKELAKQDWARTERRREG